MKTKPKNKHPEPELRHPAPPDDDLPVGAIVEIADWALDLAHGAADGDEDDVAKVARMRAYLHARADGRRARSPSERDLLTVMALGVAALERRHHLHGLGEYVGALVGYGFDDAGGHATPSRRAPRLTPHLCCVP